MRNPFTVIRSAVSRFFAPKVKPAPAPTPAPSPYVVIRHAEPSTVIPSPSGYVPSQKARNARRKERQATAQFILALNRARG